VFIENGNERNREMGKAIYKKSVAAAQASTFSPPPIRHAPVPIPLDAVWISAKQVRARYGNRSEMWLVRRLKNDKDFPRPTKFERLLFFRIAELERYDEVVQGRVKLEA
jgi:hypothetical protein